MIRRAVPALCALLVTTAAVSACAPTSVYQGFQAIDAKPQDVKVGEAKNDVLARLGTPTEVSTFDPNVWFYISQVSQTESFYRPKTLRRDVVAVSFDKTSDTVAKVDVLSLKDGRVIAFNNRETPTRGRTLSGLEQILGTLGAGGMLSQDQDITPGERPAGGH